MVDANRFLCDFDRLIQDFSRPGRIYGNPFAGCQAQAPGAAAHGGEFICNQPSLLLRGQIANGDLLGRLRFAPDGKGVALRFFCPAQRVGQGLISSFRI